MPHKVRIDQLMVMKQLADTRTQAAAMIMAGLVRVGDRVADKPGLQLPEDSQIHVLQKPHPWVSRAGIKLAHALTYFQLPVDGRICLDIGASTGGFCDVLLHKGAAKIYAVDVGHGQLAWKIASNPRVIVLDKTNARHLTQQHVPEPPEVVTCDTSFISLKQVLPAALSLSSVNAWLVALIKPQFEVGKNLVGKGGIVREPLLHRQVCQDIQDWILQQQGWQFLGITDSPITGTDGNREFLLAAKKKWYRIRDDQKIIASILG